MRTSLLAALLSAGSFFVARPVAAQRSAVADVGFAYRNIQRPAGQAPFTYGDGRVVLTDGTELPGEVRLRIRRGETRVAYRNGPATRELGENEVREFYIGTHRYVRRPELASGWVEILSDAGPRLQLYEAHGSNHVLLARTPATNAVTAISARIPVRGYTAGFERSLRTLFADRPDLVKLIDGHYITVYNVVKVVDAYNSGQPMQF